MSKASDKNTVLVGTIKVIFLTDAVLIKLKKIIFIYKKEPNILDIYVSPFFAQNDRVM